MPRGNMETPSICEHCGGLVDEHGMSLSIKEDPSSAENEMPEEEEPKRDFAKAVEGRKS